MSLVVGCRRDWGRSTSNGDSSSTYCKCWREVIQARIKAEAMRMKRRTALVSAEACQLERVGEIQCTSQELGSCLGCRRAWNNLSVGAICIIAKVDN